MSTPYWPGIRPGATAVSVYNEALLVYLWDEAHLSALRESEADFESGYAETEEDIDDELKRLARDGVLVAYELVQDDPVSAEVVVGPPLTAAELAVGRWHKPQTARLRLPSGVLRVDTANTLPVHDDPEDEPGRVTVPPGEYVLSLYRLDRERLEDEGWVGPEEVIVLTPAAGGPPVKRAKALLRHPSAG